MVTPKGSMSTEEETLQFAVLPHRCSICPPFVTRQTSILQIPKYRTLSYSLSTPCFVTTAPLAVKPASTPRRLAHTKTWRDSVLIDVLLSAVSVLVVEKPSLKFSEGLMNYPLFWECLFENINSKHRNNCRPFP